VGNPNTQDFFFPHKVAYKRCEVPWFTEQINSMRFFPMSSACPPLDFIVLLIHGEEFRL
jgi:hypothetical protein